MMMQQILLLSAAE